MTIINQKTIFKTCDLILEKLCSKEIQSILVDSGEYVNKIFDSFTTGQLQKEIGISYENLFDSIGLLIENKHIQTTTPLNNDNVVQIVLNTEKTKCEISQKGYNAFRYGFYRNLISDIEYSETLKENNKKQHQSILDTNENIRLTNKIIWISVIATCISTVAAIMTYQITFKSNQREELKQKTTDTINILKEQLQKVSYRADVAKNLNDSLYQIIDSLTKTN